MSQQTAILFQIQQLFQESVRHQHDDLAKPLIISHSAPEDGRDGKDDSDPFAAIAALVQANQLDLADDASKIDDETVKFAREYAFETKEELRDFITDTVQQALQTQTPHIVRQAMIDALLPQDKGTEKND